jgi:predicted Zn finger-like uncharacterized protein
MFTQCPDCQTTFRVTADVLQLAEGRVRCGGCGNAFNALEHMSKNDKATIGPDDQTSTATTSSQNKQLLETLDKLAGPDGPEVTLEDTGVEWHVLKESEAGEGANPDATGSLRFVLEDDEEEEAADKPAMLGRQVDIPKPVSDAQESLELPETDPPKTSPGERRYDDNTILPDDFGDEDNLDELPFLEKPESPKRRAGDREAVQDSPEFDEAQVDLALGEPDDWLDLLGEVDDEEAAEVREDEVVVEASPAEEAEKEPPEEEATADEPPDEDMPSDIDTQFLLQAEEMGLDTGRHLVLSEDEVDALAETISQELDEDEVDEEDEADDDLDETDIGELDSGLDEEDEEEEDDEDLDLDEALALDDEDATELESTGAFEAQIGVAEKALAGEDDEEETEEPVELELEEVATASRAKDDEESDTTEDTFATMIGGKAVSEHFNEGSALVETIIMEGDMVGDSINKKRRAPAPYSGTFEDPGPLDDTYSLSRDKIRGGRRATDPAGHTVMVSVIVLAVLLLVQIMHQSRQSLATNGAFNHTIGSVYRVIGKPVTPDWDIRGWQFETTSNSVDEEQDLLTIYSSIANKSGEALPYPLVHISLTDRWEDIIGSRVLEPNEYLAGDLDPRMPVPTGESFTAVITIESPSAEATGFKLTVCYRVEQGRVRCATQDFKN